MRAAVNTAYGPPEVVTVSEVPTPTPGTGELLVRVAATTVNRTDCAYRAAHPFFMRAITGLRRPKRTILGTEFAGEVVGTGDQVDRFVVGDQVFGYCEGPFGAHAEYVVVHQTSLVTTVPGGVSLEVAAAATEGFHYARPARTSAPSLRRAPSAPSSIAPTPSRRSSRPTATSRPAKRSATSSSPSPPNPDRAHRRLGFPPTRQVWDSDVQLTILCDTH